MSRVKYRNLIAGLVLILILVNVEASQPSCNAGRNCQISWSNSTPVIQLPEFFEVLRDSFGEVIKLNQRDAIDYCQNPNYIKQPAHLATVRDFGLLATSLGARGFVNSCIGVTNDRCSYIDSINYDGGRSEYFFNDSGISIPTSYSSVDSFWTSSSYTARPDLNAYFVYGNFIGQGSLGADSHQRAVLCVAGVASK